jgi:ribosomal protein L11
MGMGGHATRNTNFSWITLTDRGNIKDFLGMHVQCMVATDRQVEISMTQTGLIYSIITNLGLDANSAKHKKHVTSSIFCTL